MAKRIHDIAKELGIKSKAIIDKCVAEGVPADKVKNHMATLSPGLEASIREWFASTPAEAEAVGVSTAVENTEHINIDAIRAKPRRRAAGHKPADSAGDAHDHEVATADPDDLGPVEPLSGSLAEPAISDDAQSAAATIEPKSRLGLRPSEPTTRIAPTEQPHIPTEHAVPEAPTHARHIPPEVVEAPPEEHRRAVARAPEPKPPTPPPAPEGHQVGARRGPSGVTPAPMNVPTRPTNVSPVGRKLETKTPVKLTGPKVIRIEAPEFIERPKPRRVPGPGESTGAPRPGGTGGDDDDRSRNAPRRGPA
ncbi:MAG: translation initiation factor IF-2 N-terminal domain-containing protein, partial [Phycisphaerales bacterium]|nr:translation initiation factor IF-2 N-terminal domain-containing protein [Phycisphaerales bacterium]